MTKVIERRIVTLDWYETEMTKTGFDSYGWVFDDDGHTMGNADDSRKDSIVKQEIYEMCIKDKYNVLFVLDDRDQVVNMWREQGLKCLQVAEGNF